MVFSEEKKRETLIATILITLCSISLLVGAFIIQRDSKKAKNSDNSKIVEGLRKDKIVVIALEGVIYDTIQDRAPFRTLFNTAYIKDELLKAIDDKHTKGVLLRLNSPGGTVAASQEIYQLVHKLRENKKAVVTSMGDLCASGCYYIASASDLIVSNRGTITGSIGVIKQGVNYKGLIERYGIYDQTFKSGKYKDLGSPQRDMTAEEKAILQKLLDDSYDQFLSDVTESRNMERAKVEKIAQGLIYTGRQALEIGLVDQLGSYEDSKDVIKKVIKEKYKYSRASSLRFDETWDKSKLSSLDDLLEFSYKGMTNESPFKELIEQFFGYGLVNNNFSMIKSDYQMLWMLH